jgi:hypothetical protein
MYGYNMIPQTFSFAKLLSGLGKTLNFANQVIPIYKEVRPIIGNAKNILSIAKEFSSTGSTPTLVKNVSNKTTIKKETTNRISSSLPVFFQ